MNEEQILELLKSRLSIEIEKDSVAYTGEGLRISLKLDDKVISTDLVITKSWSDY